MALTVTERRRSHAGSQRVRVVDVTFDNSYVTGGESLTPSDVGLTEIDQVVGLAARNSGGTQMIPVAFDHANNKLQAYRYDGASAGKANLEEVANAVDLSAFTARLTVYGR